ncbi:MAG: hypothetical protein R3B70_17990 [Polyangiaceae bacterium]
MDPDHASRPLLESFGQKPAPPELSADLRCLLDLPDAAKKRFWEALGPALAEPIPDAVEARLTDFCRRHEVDDDLLARGLKASRHLIRAAAAADLDRARFAADIARAAGEPAAAPLQALLLAGYDAARTFLRDESIERTLADHPDLATHFTHRIDHVVASTHAASLDLRLLTLTFDTPRAQRLTVTLTPAQIADLARACARALSSSSE